jgi:release factor glutamine methyltransferase
MAVDYSRTDDHQAVRKRQPYDVVLEGIPLVIDKDVFPPDVGYTTRNMGRVIAHYKPKAALDMGCGSGYLPLVMRRLQIPLVWAADVHPLAVSCARKNCERNIHLSPITVVQSNLFEKIPSDLQFDLITFHQPYFPSTESEFIAGTADGGRPVIERFFDQAKSHLRPGGVIIMAFQDTAGPENDPRNVALEQGLVVRTVFRESEWEINRYIYEISYSP